MLLCLIKNLFSKQKFVLKLSALVSLAGECTHNYCIGFLFVYILVLRSMTAHGVINNAQG